MLNYKVSFESPKAWPIGLVIAHEVTPYLGAYIHVIYTFQFTSLFISNVTVFNFASVIHFVLVLR